MAADTLRQSLVGAKTTVVVKVGTNVLADADRANSTAGRIESLAEQIRTAPRGRAAGGARQFRGHRGGRRQARPRQAADRPAAPPGVRRRRAVGPHAALPGSPRPRTGIHAAQILLTASDFDSRARYLNVRNTISTLFEYDALPIINENDTVSVAEIKFGDNDHLAAMVTNLLHAPLLVLLTNVDGLYSDDPRTDPDAKLLATVPHIDAAVTGWPAATQERPRHRRHAEQAEGGPPRDRRRRGGRSWPTARSTASSTEIFAGEPVGTLFLPHGETFPAWKRWLGFTAQPKGKLTVDAGAVGAVVRAGQEPAAGRRHGRRRGTSARATWCRFATRRRGVRPRADNYTAADAAPDPGCTPSRSSGSSAASRTSNSSTATTWSTIGVESRSASVAC